MANLEIRKCILKGLFNGECQTHFSKWCHCPVSTIVPSAKGVELIPTSFMPGILRSTRSVIPRTCTMWNGVSSEGFSMRYDMKFSKKRINGALNG